MTSEPMSRFRLILPDDLPADQREEVLAMLDSYASVSSPTYRSAEQLQEWMVVVHALKDTLETGALLYTLAKASPGAAKKVQELVNDRMVPATRRATALVAAQLILLRKKFPELPLQVASGDESIDVQQVSDEELLRQLLREPAADHDASATKGTL